MNMVNIVARCLCRHDGFIWSILPTWRDEFTGGLSHQDYLEEAERLLNEELSFSGASSRA